MAETQRTREEHLSTVKFWAADLFLTLYVPQPDNARLWTPDARARASASQMDRLEQVASSLLINLRRFGLRRLSSKRILEIYGYLANLTMDCPFVSSLDLVAEQLPGTSVEWSNDGLRVGSQHAKLFSLHRTPKASHPNLFGELLRINGDMTLVLESQRRSTQQTQAAVSAQETFKNIFREKLLTMVSYLGNSAALDAKPKSAASQAADASVTGIAGILQDVDEGAAYTQTS